MNARGLSLPPPNVVSLKGSTHDAVHCPAANAAGWRPHICFVSLNIYPILTGSTEIEFAGGGEVQQVMLARLLRSDGYPVSVLTSDHGQGPDVVHDGIRIHSVPRPGHRGIKGLRFLHPLLTDVVAGLDRVDPDVVYFRVIGSRAAAVAWYARTRGKRFVYACASDREFLPKPPGVPRRDAMLFRWAVRRAHSVLVQNTRQLDLLRANYGMDALVLPNCYAEPEAGNASAQGPVLWVGTFKPIKRPELFIELARRHPERRFVMVGGADNANDPEQAFHLRMRSLAAVEPNLTFAGYVPFSLVGRHFDGASVLVNTSDSEGFPNTFLQAWARGVPTLSFVAPEVMGGRCGTIACQSLDDMSVRLTDLLREPGRWQAASEACRAHFVNVHSPAAVLDTYRRVLHRLCPAPRAHN